MTSSQTVRGLLDQPGNKDIHVALENAFIKITRQPEDLLAIIREVDHPRFGANFDADNFYNAGIEPFPYAYELLRGHIIQLHAKDSARYIAQVHGEARRVLHRAGGNVVCLPLGTGRRQLGGSDRPAPTGPLPRAGVAGAPHPARGDGERDGAGRPVPPGRRAGRLTAARHGVLPGSLDRRGHDF